jgi:hypothetical protein
MLCSALVARQTKEQKMDAMKTLQVLAVGAGVEAAFEELVRNDARYRWLRAQHWDTSQLCVVAKPKAAVKLGHCCPSGEYLDIAVDDAMLIGRAVGAA